MVDYMKTRWIAILTVLAMSLSFCAPVLADTSGQAPSKMVAITDEAAGKFALPKESILYDDVSVEISDDLVCEFSFSLSLGDDVYEIVTSGCLEEYDLNAESVLHGCLRGNATVKGIDYEVSVGFTKSETSDELNAGVLLMPCGEPLSNEAIMFGVGDYKLPGDLVAESLETIDTIESSEVASSAAVQPDDPTNGVTVTGAIGNPISQSVRIGVIPNTDSVRDYVDDYYNNPGINYSFSLALSSLELKASKTTAYFDFDGLYENNVSGSSEYSGFNTVFWAVVADCLSAIPGVYIPSTVLTTLANMWTEPTEEKGKNTYRVRAKGGSLYDGIEDYGIACEIAVKGNASGTPGSGTVTCYGKATYVVSVYLAPDGNYTYYLDAEDYDYVTVNVYSYGVS